MCRVRSRSALVVSLAWGFADFIGGVEARRAVAASLYPAVNALLAARILRERLGPAQRAGVAVAIIGIAAITAGG